ncbi:OLC1v1019391C1 [Oldenlandia corymbosa var. corymbosa]|uniref:OLC1v1019391C1 n=1 Tax=Oldenlandia corymbosa var. corymbosa TaxID=529605 RepID=A0AAV1EED1_OLDCO|nr:OLC1v1019391C1 [Oldenlandia corymbosa var. corymbosa]
MEALQTKEAAAATVTREEEVPSFMVDDDDLLNFSLDDGDEEPTKNITSISKGPSFSSSIPLLSHNLDDDSPPFPEFVEEELEWLSNKDSFPSVETCFDLLSEDPEMEALDHQSPVSVLENSSSSSISNGSSSGNGSTIMSCSGSLQVPTSFPVRARSKRRLKKRTGFGDFSGQQLLWWKQLSVKNNNRREVLAPLSSKVNNGASIGRRCLHCNTDQTPQWRAGPMGPKTLCNACGVRYKSGRLVPEYRPASSPTFSAALHSNSHRKIIEMRKQKQIGMGGFIETEIGLDDGGRGLWI